MAYGFWTDARIELIRQGAAEGLTDSQIVKKISATLSSGITPPTKGSVISKRIRSGITLNRTDSPTGAARREEQRRQQVVMGQIDESIGSVNAGKSAALSNTNAYRRRFAAEAAGDTTETTRTAKYHPDMTSLNEMRRITLMELDESTCRWPIGDPCRDDFSYCGNHSTAWPYCVYHHGLAFKASVTRP